MTSPARVLIVDDEPNVRLVFRTALEPSGYAVAEAADGEAALLCLQVLAVDLVLLDLQMPRLGGMEVLGCIRDSGYGVPVAIVTAHGSVPDAVAAMKLGAIDFVAKPLTPVALRGVVADVILRHAAPGDEPVPSTTMPGAVTLDGQFVANLERAKRALNRREFAEAEVFLRQAIGLVPGSAEAHNLMGVLHECRNAHDASYREYRAALAADRHYGPALHNMRRYYERFTFGRSDVPIDTGLDQGTPRPRAGRGAGGDA